MPAPLPTVFNQGLGAVSADNLNTFVQGSFTYALMRTFTGVPGMMLEAVGGAAASDGGQGFFYWNATIANPVDDGYATIVPNLSVLGAWIRVPLPTPTTTHLGGVFAATAPGGQVMLGITTTGAPIFNSPPTNLVLGPGTTVVGHLATWANTTGNLLADGGAVTNTPPQTTVYTSGSGSYTPPASALYLYVEMVGGGGGGQGGGTSPGSGGTGGATTFGASLTAGGGTANGSAGATATGGDVNLTGSSGGLPGINAASGAGWGGTGASSYFGGGGPGATQQSTTAGVGIAPGSGGGAGNGGTSGAATTPGGFGGNAGAFLIKRITGVLAGSYAYSVGIAGAGGTVGSGVGTPTAGAAGAAGFIIVVAYFQ